jgi:hypothetical protein
MEDLENACVEYVQACLLKPELASAGDDRSAERSYFGLAIYMSRYLHLDLDGCEW